MAANTIRFECVTEDGCEIQDPQVMRGDEVAVEEAGKVAVL